MAGSMLRSLTEKLDQIFASLPALGAYFAALPQQFDWRETALLVGIVVAGLAAEWFDAYGPCSGRGSASSSAMPANRRCAPSSTPRCSMPWRCWRCGSPRAWSAAQVGDAAGRLRPASRTSSWSALLYWRGFNFVFRAWLRPNTPEGRIAPVDDATAQRLLVGLNVVIVLPMIGAPAADVHAAPPAPRRR